MKSAGRLSLSGALQNKSKLWPGLQGNFCFFVLCNYPLELWRWKNAPFVWSCSAFSLYTYRCPGKTSATFLCGSVLLSSRAQVVSSSLPPPGPDPAIILSFLGKGTQSEKIQQDYQIPCISTGNLLRQQLMKETPLGKLISEQMRAGGELNPDLSAISTDCIRHRIGGRWCGAEIGATDPGSKRWGEQGCTAKRFTCFAAWMAFRWLSEICCTGEAVGSISVHKKSTSRFCIVHWCR